MKIKKYLRNRAEKDAENLLTEADRQFCLQLATKTVEQHREEKPRSKRQILKFVLVGILLCVTVILVEFCCIYAVQGDNTWNYLKDVWSWYKTLL